MKCLFCRQETPTNTSTGRKRKYCSRKCANKFYQKEGRYNKYKGEKAANPNSDYGKKSKKAKAETAKRKEEYKWYKENWLTKEQIAESIGIAPMTIWSRVKKLNIEYKLIHDGLRSTKAFFNPEDIEKIKKAGENPDPPEGYLTSKQAIEYLGCTKQFFWTLRGAGGRKRLEPSMIQTGVSSGHRNLYSIEDLAKWKKERDDYKKACLKAKEDRIKQKQKIAAEKIAKFKKETEGLITAKAAAVLMGYKSAAAVHQYKEKLNAKQFVAPAGPKFYFNPEKVKQLVLELKQAKLLKAKQLEALRLSKGLSRAGCPLRKGDWTSIASYESRFWKRIKKYGLPKWAKNTEVGQTAIAKNIFYRDSANKGIIIKLNCNGCDKQLPYTEFYVEFKAPKGRRWKCKVCHKKRRPSKSIGKPEQRMRTLIALSVKSDLSKRNNNYLDMSIREIWDNLEKYCGYNHIQLTEHLQAHFSKQMNWNNHGQLTKNKEFKWQIDHIKPRSSFNYKNFSEPEFIECWSLQNFKPIEARMNIIKSNKSLRGSMCTSFRHGLLKGKGNSGIWNYLPYTVQQARKHIESLFDETMNWDNHGTYWHIDHIIPQAYLSYTSIEQENFNTCWNLNNLQPLRCADNNSKLSKYKNILWAYNEQQSKI